MDKIINYAPYLSAVYYLCLILICGTIAYYTVVKKMDHNLQLRNIVFRVIISIFLGSIPFSILSQFVTAAMVSTRLIASPVFSPLFQILNSVLYLGFGAAFFWAGRNISMSFGYSYKQYKFIKLTTALALGWIARDVIWLIMSVVLVILTTVFN